VAWRKEARSISTEAERATSAAAAERSGREAAEKRLQEAERDREEAVCVCSLEVFS
jgi:hypothetical protein